MRMFIVLIMSMAMTYCKKTQESPAPPMTAPPATSPPASTNTQGLRYLALGDSYTIGESVKSTERCSEQVIAALQQNGLVFQPVKYIAATGWTTGSLLNAMNSTALQPPYDIVTLLIGVNDQYQGVSLDLYKQRFSQLLQKSIDLTGNIHRVFVISIPDYSVTPYVSPSDSSKIRKAIDEFNMANATITASFNVEYINVTEVSREARTNKTLLANDSLHPSGAQYARWAQLIAPVIKNGLN